MGEESEINRFDRKLTELIEYYTRYGHISPQVIDQIYDGGLPDVAPSNSDNQQIIVYGNNGLIVRGPDRQPNTAAGSVCEERPDLRHRTGRIG